MKTWNDSKITMATAIGAFAKTIGTEGDHAAFVATLTPSTPPVEPARLVSRTGAKR